MKRFKLYTLTLTVALFSASPYLFADGDESGPGSGGEYKKIICLGTGMGNVQICLKDPVMAEECSYMWQGKPAPKKTCAASGFAHSCRQASVKDDPTGESIVFTKSKADCDKLLAAAKAEH